MKIKYIISKNIEALNEKLKVLNDPVRLEIINVLDKPKYVKEINKILNIEPTLSSHHIAKLREDGMLEATKKGKCVLYARTKKCPNLNTLARCVKVDKPTYQCKL